MAPTQPQEPYRVVLINDAKHNQQVGFCDNFIVTSKYTMISFVPKFLFETFRKLANLYFLTICIMQCIPQISNTNGQPSSLPPLTFIISVDAVFAILEDRKRHIADHVANSRPALVLDFDKQSFVTKKWSEIAVGDIIKLNNRDAVPADILIVGVSEPVGSPPTGLCYVETKSLDGETNMKVRQALECTVGKISTAEHLMAIRGRIQCEHPNNAINSFQGVFEWNGAKFSIPYESIILRGCIVRNTDWVYGIVFNTGKDTKIMRSNSAPPSKMSTMDRSINGYILVLLGCLAIFSFVGATGEVLFSARTGDHWYLLTNDSGKGSFSDWITMFFYYSLLMYQFVPISLSVSMSMVKYLQAQFIQWDKEMYYAETDTPALVRSMSLNEELGQISYIFTDKTGTLTCNLMEFRKCSIGGVSYGHGTTEIGLAALKRAGKPLPPQRNTDSHKPAVPFVNFDGPELFDDLRNGVSGEAQQRKIDFFFTHLAICHTVIPERLENSDTVTLSASSPDEQALVSGAAYFGYEFMNRSTGVAYVNINGTKLQFEVLNVLEFNSTRKRMSVIVKHSSGKIHLYTKGADSIVFSRLAKDKDCSQHDLQEITKKHIDQYADDGLRTLTVAMREISEEYYEKWSDRYHHALNNLEEIDKRKKDQPNAIDMCMEEIEVDLELLGATAIEDKLQQGVPDTIAHLATAGIKIWVLTGDKEETAINIGFACQLVTNEMKIVIINSKRFPTSEAIEEEILGQTSARQSEIDRFLATPPSSRSSGLRQIALVIDGECLTHALSKSCHQYLVTFAQYCKAVIACRVSPAQKAQMVALIKNNVPGVRTLAIGDGANDVSMIQEAHIGVGISGQEGMQAVNSSDYAIARFRYLERLLLVHGRWNYRRLAQLVLYIFYKNILFTASQYWFTLMSGFSGQKFFLETGVQLYNLLLTSGPIVALSVFDRDVCDSMAMKFPKLYFGGPRDEDLNRSVFSAWIIGAICESLVITFLSIYSMHKGGYSGESSSMWLQGNIIFTLVVLIANIKLMLFQNSWLFFNHVLYWGSVVMWIVIAFVASLWSILSDLAWENMVEQTFRNTCFWLLIVLVPPATLVYVWLANAIKTTLFPEYWQLVKEVQKYNLDDELLRWDDHGDASVLRPVTKTKSREGKTKIAAVVPLERASTGLHHSPTKRPDHGFAYSIDLGASAAEAKLMLSQRHLGPGSGITDLFVFLFRSYYED